MNDLNAFIHGLPKAELHLHIEGTLEAELKFELAKRNGVELPYNNVEELKSAYDFNDLSSFLAVYYEGMSVLIKAEDFYDLTIAYLNKAHAQNVVYAEIFFDPQAHISRGIKFETVISGIRRAQQEAQKTFGLRSQLIMCFLRDMSAESAMETLYQSLEFKDWIVGIGLDSDEKDNPPVKFKKVFEKAKKENYKVTAHCDVDQDNSVQHIWQCLNDLQVNRIDHGVNSLEDSKLCDEIMKRDLGLTVCPISNRHITANLKAKEIKTMLDTGMKVTVNSDDPAYFPGYLYENLVAVTEAVNLGKKEIINLTENTFNASWISQQDKEGYLNRVAAYVATSHQSGTGR